jgi:hypothetical protein
MHGGKFLVCNDLVEVCRDRKKEAKILKLDFSIAFDTLFWVIDQNYGDKGVG